MPFLGSFEVEAGKTWGYYESPARYILDTFNRAASGTLGISTNGQLWNTLAGTWYVNSSYQAETDTSATGYPIATYDLVDTNQLAYANVSPGMGVAFSIQNANNWYAVVSYDNSYNYSCDCSTCSYCNTCSWCSGGYVTDCGLCGSEFVGWVYTCLTCCGGYTNNQTDCYECGSTNYTCCGTCTAYEYYLTILQCVNGTINTINTLGLSQDPASISVEVNNGVVNYYAYSTNITGIVTQPNGLGTLLASGTLTISGTFGTQIGMVKSPSYDIQGVTISGFFGTGL